MNVRSSVSRVGQRRQVVIPKEICAQLGLREGDFVEVKCTKSAVVIKPKRLVDPDDILTSEEERRVRRGQAQLRRDDYVAWEDVKKRLKL